MSDDGPTRLSQIAEHDGRLVASHYLLLLAAWAFVPALLGLSRLLRGPRVTLGQVGAALLLIGWISTIAFFGLGAYEHEAAAPTFNLPLTGQLVEHVNESPVMIPMIILTFVVGIAIGSLIVAWALWRRKVVPAWAAAALVVWTVLDISADNVALSALAAGFLLVGLGAVGLTILRMSDEAWDSMGRAPGGVGVLPDAAA